jgi:hypothetical protein
VCWWERIGSAGSCRVEPRPIRPPIICWTSIPRRRHWWNHNTPRFPIDRFDSIHSLIDIRHEKKTTTTIIPLKVIIRINDTQQHTPVASRNPSAPGLVQSPYNAGSYESNRIESNQSPPIPKMAQVINKWRKPPLGTAFFLLLLVIGSNRYHPSLRDE